MPGKKKLEEEYQKLDEEKIDEDIKKKEKEVEEKKHELLKFRLRKFKNDGIYIFIISIILGFILWAWKPSLFSYTKALALGLAWYMLFDDLQLQKMFRKQ